MRKLVFLTLLLIPVATAQKLTVATGSKTGTYSQIYKDMGTVCLNTSLLLEMGTAGSLENIELLLNKKATLGFVQVDVLKAKQQIDLDERVNNIKVLLPLYNEEIHVIAPPLKKGMFGKVSGATKFSELKVGTTVGAWGGSVVTAKVLKAQGKLGYNIQVFPDQASAVAALNGGKLDAIIAVGGAPVDWVTKLSNVRLLPIDIAGGGLYKSARISYSNISLDSVPTLSVQSVLATRNISNAAQKKALLDYKKCVINKLDALQDGEGFHPKWSAVSFDKFSSWELYK